MNGIPSIFGIILNLDLRRLKYISRVLKKWYISFVINFLFFKLLLFQNDFHLNNSLDLEEASDIVNLPGSERKNEDELEHKPVKNLHIRSIIDYKYKNK